MECGSEGLGEVYVVNQTKYLIYHVYDDRGMHVISNQMDDLHFKTEK